MMHRAVIFDMDGVLVDSEPLHYESEKNVLSSIGLAFPRDIHKKFIGYSNEYKFWRDLLNELGVSSNIEDLMNKKMDYFRNNLYKISLIKPAYNLLKKLSTKGIQLALASSSSRELINEVLNKFDLFKYFSEIVSGDDVEHGKPAPDIFLKAADKLGMPPCDCIVIEDSLNGILAGHAAGMIVIAVPNEYTKTFDFSQANYLLDSLNDFYGLGLIV